MLGGCTNYLATMPEITVYINCDTHIAINLGLFNLGDNDEFIFTIKNYDYIESDYVYLYKARKSDINENSEVIFKISSEVSKRIKPGAFYNFSVMANAFDLMASTEYTKLTNNGAIRVEYGTQDFLVKPEAGEEAYEIEDIKVVPVSAEDTDATLSPYMSSRLVGMWLEEVQDV